MNRLLLRAAALLVLVSVIAALYLWSCIRAGQRDQALVAAVEAGDTEVVRSRLDEGANVNARAGVGQLSGPLDLLFWQGRARGVDVFSVAVRSDRLEVAELLLGRGANVAGPVGVDALHHAAGRGRRGMVAMLLDRGVPVDGPDWDGRSALVLAFLAKRPEVVSLLLDRGADFHKLLRTYRSVSIALDPNARVIDVYSDLNWDGATVRALLRHGLPVGTRLLTGQRPLLTTAVLAGDRETVALLLRGGADVGAKDDLGRTALYYADFQSRKEIAALLRGAGAKKDW
jgi:ankyrin repeat protein